MDLTTNYCGLTLKHPIMAGASPMSGDLDTVKHLEDAGTAAVVMPSLFEEQVVREELVTHRVMEHYNDSFAEALTHLPFPDDFHLGPIDYIEHLEQVRQAVDIPVIGSLNGTSPGGWISYAGMMQQAGADAIELNTYSICIRPDLTAGRVEDELVELVEALRQTVTIPLAVKLSPYHTALPNLASRLEQAGVDSLVMFNRHFQPDIDIDELDVVPTYLSDPSELTLRLRWLGILDAKVPSLTYACTGGVHTAQDIIKSLMCGADAVQMVSALLKNGPQTITQRIAELSDWLDDNEYKNLAILRGSMNYDRCPSRGVYTRAHYVKQLQADVW